jgi:hypothetical protein
LAQQPDGLEVDVDDLEKSTEQSGERKGEHRGSLRAQTTTKERRTSSQSFSENSVHGDRR